LGKKLGGRYRRSARFGSQKKPEEETPEGSYRIVARNDSKKMEKRMSVTEPHHSVGDILRPEHHGLLQFLSKKS
jgi:hypothetical protein